METNSPASSGRLSAEERERILRSFEAWLDGALGSEAPPQGLTPELLFALQSGDPLPQVDGRCDLYSLWAAMITLTQEVRLQGRTFKQLNETLARGLERPATEAPGLVAAGSEAVESSSSESPATGQAKKQDIEVLLDLRDRIERGRSAVRSAAEQLAPSRLPWLTRWLGVGGKYARQTQEILAALIQGYSLTLDRLDQALMDRRVTVMVCVGQMFDPRRMNAIEIEETDSVPEGTVVEVYRNGYEWDGGIYRSAQVKVARPPERNYQ
jgi:hypothetical protein